MDEIVSQAAFPENIYEVIKNTYRTLVEKSKTMGTPTNNIGIYAHSTIIEHLSADEIVIDGVAVPLIRDNKIEEYQNGDQKRSDILIYDPDWVIEEPLESES